MADWRWAFERIQSPKLVWPWKVARSFRLNVNVSTNCWTRKDVKKKTQRNNSHQILTKTCNFSRQWQRKKNFNWIFTQHFVFFGLFYCLRFTASHYIIEFPLNFPSFRRFNQDKKSIFMLSFNWIFLSCSKTFPLP